MTGDILVVREVQEDVGPMSVTMSAALVVLVWVQGSGPRSGQDVIGQDVQANHGGQALGMEFP